MGVAESLPQANKRNWGILVIMLHVTDIAQASAGSSDQSGLIVGVTFLIFFFLLIVFGVLIYVLYKQGKLTKRLYFLLFVFIISVPLLGMSLAINSAIILIAWPVLVGLSALLLYSRLHAFSQLFIDPKDKKDPDAVYRYKNKLLDLKALDGRTFKGFLVVPYDNDMKERKLRKVIKKEPDNAHAHFLLGKLLIEMGNPAEGSIEIEIARSLKPDFPDYKVDVDVAPRVDDS